MLPWDGINGCSGVFGLSECHLDPDVFQHVRKLAKQAIDAGQAGGEELMHPIFDRLCIPHVVDPHGVVELTNTLDAALALLQAGRIPGQV